MAVRKPRTSVDDYDYIQTIREHAEAARKLASGAARKNIGMAAAFEKMLGSVGAGSGKNEDPLAKYEAWRKQYEEPIINARKRLGELAGSSQGKGQVWKTTSPGIPRNPTTGARKQPTLSEPAAPEYLREGLKKPSTINPGTSYTLTPKDQASFELGERNVGIINARANARQVGGAIAKEIGNLSEYLVRMGEAAKVDLGVSRKAFYSAAGPAVGSRTRAKLNIPQLPKRPRPATNEPVRPSVEKAKPLTENSKLEPNTGAYKVPDVFKKAINDNLGGGTALSIAGPSLAMLGGGMDELFTLSRMKDYEGGSGGGGILKDKKKAL